MTAGQSQKLNALIDAMLDEALGSGFTNPHRDAILTFVDHYGQAQRREGRRDARKQEGKP